MARARNSDGAARAAPPLYILIGFIPLILRQQPSESGRLCMAYITLARPPPSKPGTRSCVIQGRSQPSRCSHTASVPWASYRLTPQQIDWTIGDEATALPDGLVRPPVWRKSVEEEMKILGEQMKEEPNVGRGEPTSGLEPLTCSLRVCGQGLLGVAHACNFRIDRPVSFLCFALCCTVLRSRWCQNGVRST